MKVYATTLVSFKKLRTKYEIYLEKKIINKEVHVSGISNIKFSDFEFKKNENIWCLVRDKVKHLNIIVNTSVQKINIMSATWNQEYYCYSFKKLHREKD